MKNAAAKFRAYLAARDLSEPESAGGLAVGVNQSAQHAGSVPDRIAESELAREPRLPFPLPGNVELVARASLAGCGLVSLFGALFVVVSGVAVVLFPILLGREGVGRSMVTLFLFCSAIVATGLALLAARGAARVLRRERRGVDSLLAWMRIGALASAIVVALSWWLNVAFFGEGEGLAFNWKSIASIGTSIAALLFFVWAILVMRRYRAGIE